MKKIIFTFLLAVTCIVSANAGDKLKLVSGNVSSLKDGGTATVVIDLVNTTYDKKIPLRQDARYANIDNQIPNFTSEFIREFNENSKKFKLVEGNDAKYNFIVVVDDLDYHVNVMSFKGGHATKIEGTVFINQGNENVAQVIFQHESTGFTFDLSVEETLEGLAKNLAKKISKGKF